MEKHQFHQQIIQNLMGGALGLIESCLDIGNFVMSTALAIETGTALAYQATLKEKIKDEQNAFKLMSQFQPILQNFVNSNGVGDQIKGISSVAISNWTTIANNLASFAKYGVSIRNVRLPAVSSKMTWVSLSVGVVFFGISIAVLLWNRSKKRKAGNIEDPPIQDLNEGIENDIPKLQLAQRQIELQVVVYDDDGNPTFISPEQDINIGVGEKSTFRKIYDSITKSGWASRLLTGFNFLMLGASIYFFVQGVWGIQSLQGQINEINKDMSSGGKIQTSKEQMLGTLKIIVQDISNLMICSYVTLMDLCNSSFFISTLNPKGDPLNQIGQIAQTFNPEGFVEGFNLEYVKSLAIFAQATTNEVAAYFAFKADTGNSPQAVMDKLDSTLQTIYNQFIQYQPVDNPSSSASNIMNSIAIQISSNATQASLVSNSGLTTTVTFNNFVSSVGTSFEERKKDIAKYNLTNNLENNNLSVKDVELLSKIDFSIMKNIIKVYLNDVYQQIEQNKTISTLSMSLQWSTFIKTSLTSDIIDNLIYIVQTQCDRFFLDSMGQENIDPATAGYTIFGKPIVKQNTTLHQQTQAFAISNMISLPSVMTFLPSQQKMLTMVQDQLATNPLFAYSDINQTQVSRELWMTLKQVTGLSEPSKGNSSAPSQALSFRLGLLVPLNSGLLYRLINDSLTSSDYKLEAYKFTSATSSTSTITSSS